MGLGREALGAPASWLHPSVFELLSWGKPPPLCSPLREGGTGAAQAS